MFISFDGIDGTGKTTQMRLFVTWLEQRGYTVTACRDPGGTGLGEQLRDVLLQKSELAICRRAEMLLYMASRAQLVDEVIRPALEAGDLVVSDRYLLANVVYQGYAGGMDVDALWQVGQVAVAHHHPDVVFVLDMPVDQAIARMDRELDRMESQGQEFMERVRQGYLAEAAKRAELVVIDAAGSVEEVQTRIRAAVAQKLPSLADQSQGSTR